MNAASAFRRGIQAFFDGFAHVFDFAGALSTTLGDLPSASQTDADALASDWRNIGDDLRQAFKHFARFEDDEGVWL